MGIIKKLLFEIETLGNKIKILEGKLNNLRINVDLVNDKSKELPDTLTYKPQQPYMGVGGIGLKLIKEGYKYIGASSIPSKYYYYPPSSKKLYLLLKKSSGFIIVNWQMAQRMWLGSASPNRSYHIYYQVYEVVYNFKEF